MQREFIPGRKYAFANLGRVLILGLGVSGKALVEYLLPQVGSRVSELCILAGKYGEDADSWAKRTLDQADPALVSLEFDCEEPKGSFDLCIASPGISENSAFYKAGRDASASIISEVEFAWCESDEGSKWIAITGTNGKTTTTALTEHLLRCAGLKAKAVGNIGDACIREVSCDPQDVYVVETSSYQLASVDHFAPNVAVMLGITPDHIKWHGSFEAYAKAKFKLLSNLHEIEGAVAVLDATNDVMREKVKELKAQDPSVRGFAYIPVGTAKGVRGDMRAACGSLNAAFENDDDVLEVAFDGKDCALANANDLKILGEHNVLNALSAASAAIAIGADSASVSEALLTFAPLEHRIEPAGTVDGVSFYNDSKATNVDATLVALKAFVPKRPIVMFGGDDKGTDLADLVMASREYVKAAICYGEGGPRFYEALTPLEMDGIEVNLVGTFKEAFDLAVQSASKGDVVLLSPACASFDEFSCFEERGETFKELVSQLASKGR